MLHLPHTVHITLLDRPAALHPWERSDSSLTPKEQPPRKLSGKRTTVASDSGEWFPLSGACRWDNFLRRKGQRGYGKLFFLRSIRMDLMDLLDQMLAVPLEGLFLPSPSVNEL
jgi:hypothetical protein